jgi:hypothetical protein
VRRASLWLDLRIALMTLAVVMMRSRLSPQESSADVEQVHMKGAAAEQTMLQPEPVPAHSLPDVDGLPRPRVVVKSREKSRVLH